MHIEVRNAGGKPKYYLAQSYRQDGKVKKARVYLGVGLSQTELGKRKKQAETRLTQIVSIGRRISDPYETILSSKELAQLKALETKAEIKVAHLSEDDWRKFTEAFTYDTNAIEGSTIGAGEVADILRKGKWPDKPKGDISETYGVAKAIEFIRNTKDHISLPLILELHRIVFENSKPFAGKFRPPGVEVVVADQFGQVVHRGAPSGHIRSLLSELVKWYEKNRKRYPPLVLAAVVHNQFENIHPFQDGNGRVGRLLLNSILLKHKLPPLNITLKSRKEYYAALQAYEKRHDLRPTIKLMLKEYRGLSRTLMKR